MRRTFFATLILLTAFACPAEAARKLALVIGINNYKEVPKLEKAVGDAEAIGQALAGLGFEVSTALDVDRRGLNLALSKLYASIEPGDTVLVQYSGHGVQIESDNYLLPADVPAPEDGNADLLKSESLRLNTLVDTLTAKGAAATILIIDACRDNPFATTGKRSIGGTRGLANIATEKGTFIMYSAGVGQSALDNLGESDAVKTSVYTRVLVTRLSQSGLKLRDLAASVRADVEQMGKSIGHDQRPAYYDDLPADFSLSPAGDQPVVQQQAVYVPPKVVAPPPVVKSDNADEARQAWEAVKDQNSPAPFDIVAKRYAGTFYGDLAASRANELRDTATRSARDKMKQAVIQPDEQPAPPPLRKKPRPQPQPELQSSGNFDWAVIVGSYPRSETSKARAKLKAARAQGFDAQMINTDHYDRLTPGLYAVVIAASSRNSALTLASDVQNYFGDAYAKQLQ
jgi:Caspase domain